MTGLEIWEKYLQIRSRGGEKGAQPACEVKPLSRQAVPVVTAVMVWVLRRWRSSAQASVVRCG
eukprot:6177956-Pleurochrysis_carterae.AAC.6